jgi:transposase
VDRAHGLSLARSSGGVWRLEQRIPALQSMERQGVWRRIFEAVSDDPDFEYLIVDSTIVRAHQHAAGAKKGGLKIKRSAARAVV